MILLQPAGMGQAIDRAKALQQGKWFGVALEGVKAALLYFQHDFVTRQPH